MFLFPRLSCRLPYVSSFADRHPFPLFLLLTYPFASGPVWSISLSLLLALPCSLGLHSGGVGVALLCLPDFVGLLNFTVESLLDDGAGVPLFLLCDFKTYLIPISGDSCPISLLLTAFPFLFPFLLPIRFLLQCLVPPVTPVPGVEFVLAR